MKHRFDGRHLTAFAIAALLGDRRERPGDAAHRKHRPHPEGDQAAAEAGNTIAAEHAALPRRRCGCRAATACHSNSAAALDAVS